MVRNRLVVAAALLVSFANSANAAPKNEHKVRNAQKLIATLEKFGINDKDLKEFITTADSRIANDGYLSLRETHTMGGTLALRCDTRGLPSARKFEIRYTPDNMPEVNVIARTNIIVVRYHLDF